MWSLCRFHPISFSPGIKNTTYTEYRHIGSILKFSACYHSIEFNISNFEAASFPDPLCESIPDHSFHYLSYWDHLWLVPGTMPVALIAGGYQIHSVFIPPDYLNHPENPGRKDRWRESRLSCIEEQRKTKIQALLYSEIVNQNKIVTLVINRVKSIVIC